LAKDPSDAAIRESLAFSLAQTGQADEALRELNEVISATPQRATAWFNRGFLHDQAGRRAEAEADFLQAVTLDDKLDRAWYGLALTLIAQQRLEEAVAPLKKNIKLQPMSPYGYYQLARVYFDLGNTAEVRKIIRHLKGFEPKVATQLELETKITVAE
jgi:tetratricopeptide (TPR) repeat protein